MIKKTDSKIPKLEGIVNEKRRYETEGYRPGIVLKFQDYIEIPYEDNVAEQFEKYRIGPWDHISRNYPGVKISRLFKSLKPSQILSLTQRAREIDKKYSPPNFLTYFMVDCPPDVEPLKLINELAEWTTVEKAYYNPPGSEPQVNPDNDPRFANQGYLDPAPDGINAEFTWPRANGTGFSGGDGAGINVIDLERGWTFDHEDLVDHGATLLHGSVRDGSRAHGTAVLGEICAVDNNIGCIGIAPNIASVNAVSYWNSNRPDAIFAAIANLNYGDVLLIEAQLTPSHMTSPCPIEVLDGEFDALRLATALGIVVVEAAGNGSNNLDNYVNAAGDNILDRTSNDFRDSGAIMVGAGSSTTPHTRMGFSNFGNRVDCYAWGENVNTTSSDNSGATDSYTGTFNGTSSASPIITGAAVIVQGIAEANFGYRFNPYQIRNILSDPATGTDSDDPANDQIGVMPDLQSILQSLVFNLAPDVYLRDFVGDNGDPHTGSISASPDIILHPTQVTNPQTSYGEASGTANSNSLGYAAEAGQNNYIYVRARNRGGSDATNVSATIFWSPVSTLITPDLWNLIGTTTIPNLPSGNILTVFDPITWSKADIPATGHYCFVGLIGNADDPAPNPADFVNWDNFRRFIRENNNVTWRNFNVVDNIPDPRFDPEYVLLDFIAPGAPDKARFMQLEIVCKLPRGAAAFLEIPAYFKDLMHYQSPFLKFDKKRDRTRVPINPHGKYVFEELLFYAKSRAKLRLFVHIPKKFRKGSYEIYARQLFKGQEVGRITWMLAPKKDKLKRPRKKTSKK